MTKITRALTVPSLLGAALLLAACGSTTSLAEKPAPVESRTPTAATAAPAGGSSAGGTTAATPQSQVTTVQLGKDDPAPGDTGPRIVYFDFDSFVIKDEFKPVIERNARALSTAKGKRMVVEGHTDERGGSEYNLALGQKRAEAVVKSLTLLGVPENQLEAVSFGEERPAAQGSDESAWAKNRRAELKDK